MAPRPRFYWDACIWIELIQGTDTVRGECCKYVLELARKRKCEVWTSAFTLAEVYKKRCGNENLALQIARDENFEDLILEEFVQTVQVDFDVGVTARRILRRFPKIKKPQDGIHVATCALYDIDVLHTFDNEDLLSLNETIPKKDGSFLKIEMPPYPPQDEVTPMLLAYMPDNNGRKPSNGDHG